MASTSVHFPESLVEELDRIAKERGVSRNRLIVEACRRVIRERDVWPVGFFTNQHLTPEDWSELEDGANEFTDNILSARRSRTAPPL
jgi:hypothetical protein